ncbi:MAG: IPT/TIG domain-containing protein [Blastocatellia bacterium]|nr:IPT/TIG domain-containing protein [Blastocatellia bacterium]
MKQISRARICGVWLLAGFVLQTLFPFGYIQAQRTNPDFQLPLHTRHINPQQSGTLRIKERNPVVNETKQITLTATDAGGQPVTGVAWESGSPDIAQVDPQTGVVRGMQRGFATITAKRGPDTVSIFVAVARVESSRGAMVPGDQKQDSAGKFYISDPTGSVILRKDSLLSEARQYAGKKGVAGRTNGKVTDALFNTPTAVTVDTSAQGGVYIADTANHSIRKIDFTEQVTTLLGSGSPGRMTADTTPFAQAVFTGPRGVAVDGGGNLFIADTENHAIFYADFARREVRLLAGEPGQSGRTDGQGRQARFKQPGSLSLSADGRILNVADTGNNAVRQISRSGEVRTLSAASVKGLRFAPNQSGGDFTFNAPQSVSSDTRGNLYVVDASGVQVVTFPTNQPPQLTSLAQPTVSFGKAASVLVEGTQAFVLDASATSDAEAVKVVTVGAPQIASLSRASSTLEGNVEVIVTGKNFAPESQVVLGDDLVIDAEVLSATQIRFTVPPQGAPGNRTLSILTRGGTDQRPFQVLPKPLSELQNGEITTIAGGIPFLGDGGPATAANFQLPQRIAVDSVGNVYVADVLNNRIRKIDTSGIITTVAGTGAAGYNGDGRLAVAATLNNPLGITIDRNGDLLICDTFNSRIRRVDLRTGVIITIAGTGVLGFSGDGDLAKNAKLNSPRAIAVDGANNMLIADAVNNRIRKIDAVTSVITTIVGTGALGDSGEGGPATNAQLRIPSGVAVDVQGNIYIADSFNGKIKRVTATDRTISTVGENSALLRQPVDLALDPAGNLWIADLSTSSLLRLELVNQNLIRIAGNGTFGFGGDGGSATAGVLNQPTGVGVDGSGNIFVADQFNHRIRRIAVNSQTISTFAGTIRFLGDSGPAINSEVANPFSVLTDQNGNTFFGDYSNLRVRRISSGGEISTVVGNGNFGVSGNGGEATSAPFTIPYGLAFDKDGNLLIGEAQTNRIRLVNKSTGVLSTIAGTGAIGALGDDGPATQARLNFPTAVTVDSNGNIFICDTANDRVRRIDATTGIIARVVGGGAATGENVPATDVRLNQPFGVTVDAAGNLFVADTNGHRVRRVDAVTKLVTTVAGTGTPGDSGDGGEAIRASLNFPNGLLIDSVGNLLIADTGNHRIRQVNLNSRIITTVAGTGVGGFSGDGNEAIQAALSFPQGVALDRNGNLLIAAGFNNAIRVVKGYSQTAPLSAFSLAVNPLTQTIRSGESTSFSVSVQSVNGFNQSVGLSAVVSPPNPRIAISIASDSVNPGQSATVMVSTPASIPTSTLSLAVTGTAGTVTQSKTVLLRVVSSNVGPTLASIPDQTVKPGEVRSLPIAAADPNGNEGLRLSLQTVLPYVTLSDNGNGSGMLRLAPGIGETKGGAVAVVVTDPGGLTGQTGFIVTIGSGNQPPVLAAIADQTLAAGEAKTLEVKATDPDGNAGLKLSLVSNPGYVTLSDQGSGIGTIRIAPGGTETQSGRVIVQVTDVGGLTATTSFAVTIQPNQGGPMISNAVFTSPNLTINGTGFGSSGAQVKINGSDVSQFIKTQTATVITLKGKEKKLKLKAGANQVSVTVNGVASNVFTLNL